jgi:hypothetical protein
MPKREIRTVVEVSFTDDEWSNLVNLYEMLSYLIGDDVEQYPTVTDEGLATLIDDMQRTLDSLLVDK